MKFAGLFYVVVFVVIFCFCGLPGRIFVTVFFAVMPLAIVVGDGYFEFEKHMIPYFMAIPLFFVLATKSRFVHGSGNPEIGNGSAPETVKCMSVTHNS